MRTGTEQRDHSEATVKSGVKDDDRIQVEWGQLRWTRGDIREELRRYRGCRKAGVVDDFQVSAWSS